MKITKRDEIIHLLNISIVGDSETKFKCKDCGLVLAKGYDRIEIGGRGPYIQFDESHINLDNFHFPKQFHIFFDEYLSNCEHKVFCIIKEKKSLMPNMKLESFTFLLNC